MIVSLEPLGTNAYNRYAMCPVESAYMLGYNDLLNRPSIELNTIWEPIRLDEKKSEYEHR